MPRLVSPSTKSRRKSAKGPRHSKITLDCSQPIRSFCDRASGGMKVVRRKLSMSHQEEVSAVQYINIDSRYIQYRFKLDSSVVFEDIQQQSQGTPRSATTNHVPADIGVRQRLSKSLV